MISIAQPKLQRLSHPLFNQRGVSVAALRLDQIHPTIHGNKWFKLKRNLARIQSSGCRRVLSFGGAYSNHLYALAAAGKAFDLETIGLVRGELVKPLNAVLSFAQSQGMQLHPVARSDYRRMASGELRDALYARFGAVEILPEGGSNGCAVEGCAEIVDFLDWSHFGGDALPPAAERVVALACGTAATLAGLVVGLDRQRQSCGEATTADRVLGVSVLRAEAYLAREARAWIAAHSQELASRDSANRVDWGIDERYDFGGYARRTAELDAFVAMGMDSQLPLEHVYTGKLFFALCDQIRRGEFAPGSEIIALHTGGITA